MTRPAHLLLVLFLSRGAQARAQAPAPVYDVDVRGEGADHFLTRFAAKAGERLTLVGNLAVPVEFHHRGGTFEQIVNALCNAQGLAAKKAEDGAWTVGFPAELTLAAAHPKDASPVETVFRCRHLNADSLAQVLSATFPKLKIQAGPAVLAPTLDIQAGPAPSSASAFAPSDPNAMNGSGGGFNGGPAPGMPIMPGFPQGDGTGPRMLSSTSLAFKKHDLVLAGPAGEVKQALVLARRLDRPRRQVRINVRMSEMTTTMAASLGVQWDLSSATTSLTELPNPDLNPFQGNKGLRFGTFAHSPVTVGLALQAGEQKGEVKTLANPELLVIDGERCFILLGEKRLYPKMIGQDANGRPSFDVAELKTGVYLQMSVQIGQDGDVVLCAYPQVSAVTQLQTYAGNPYPVVQTREAQTTVRLRSGQLLAIGGLRQDHENRSHDRLPLLGSIPLIGRLFGSHTRENVKDDLLILIQPEVLDTLETQASTISEVQLPR